MALEEQTVEATFAERILARTRRRIQLFQEAGEDWRFAESLKSISEDTAQEYEGRAVLELIQNGHDAQDPRGAGRILVLLDFTSDDATLYVANEGAGFTKKNFDTITEFALSDKPAGQGIGNKGVGFRSVLQLTDWPEIYSKATPGADSYDGYCFRFARRSDIERILDDENQVAEVVEKVSPLALPIPNHPSDPVLAEILDDGFVTTVRLPLRDQVASAEARSQVNAVLESATPVLLFLDRISALVIEVRDASGEWTRQCLRREPRPYSLVHPEENDWISEVDLGNAGTYLIGRRTLARPDLEAALERSIEKREIDKRWRDWKEEASVSIALRLDDDLANGRLYTFLPMGEHSVAPLCAHAHAPFFTTLARGEMRASVTLNDYLLSELASLAVSMSRRIRTEVSGDVAASLVVDLMCWEPSERIERALEGRLGDEPFVPLIADSGIGWGSLQDSFAWPEGRYAWRVMTAQALARLDVPVVAVNLSRPRQERLERLHIGVIGRAMGPSMETLADWAEQLASTQLRSRRSDFQEWGDFYTDLKHAFGEDASTLRGRRIVLDQDEHLRPALLDGTSGVEGTNATLFFSPDADDGEAGARVPSRLRALRRRMAFTHPGIPWAADTRAFLVDNELVREYKTDRVFVALKDLLAHSPSAALSRDTLEFVSRQFPTLNPSQRSALPRIGLRVPRVDGSWARATESLFSPAWDTEGARRLEKFLLDGGSAIERFAQLRGRWIASPADWPTTVDDLPLFTEFLRSIGVRDGLLLSNLGTRLSERRGVDLRPSALASSFRLSERLAEAWAEDVDTHWQGGAHPWTNYSFDRPLTYLPGAEEVENLPAQARVGFAELVLMGLREWGDHVLSVRLRRATRPIGQQDPHEWPTPFVSFLRHFAWLPVRDPQVDTLTFSRPDMTWFGRDSELPPYMAVLPVSTRRLLATERPFERLRAVGLRLWEHRDDSAELVRVLGEILASGHIPGHMVLSFKKHYRRAWADASLGNDWPWRSDENVLLAVSRRSSLDVRTATDPGPLYVPDESHALKDSLIEFTGHPVLVVSPEHGEEVATMLETHGVQLTRLSEVDVEIWVGDAVIRPSDSHPRLLDEHTWLLPVVVLVLELKSGPIGLRTERGMRALVERLRSFRIVRLEEPVIKFADHEAHPPPTTHSLPLADDDHPTIVVWGTQDLWEETQAAAPAIVQLLERSSLQEALGFTLVKLQRLLGVDSPENLSDGVLALALETTETRVAELRQALSGDTIELAYRLRPVLVCIIGTEHAEEVHAYLSHATAEESLVDALSNWRSALPATPEELVKATRSHPSLAELRNALRLDFRAFNDALVALGPPYSPITHPDLHEATFADYVQRHGTVILDRLRERFVLLARSGEDVSTYASLRNLDDLTPDPAWLSEYAEPPEHAMRERVSAWLREQGCSDDLARPPSLETVSDLHQWNDRVIADTVAILRPRMAAWCRLNGGAVPRRWIGAPAMEAKVVVEASGVGDLLPLDERRLIHLLAEGMGWPDDMPLATDLDTLNLTPDDVVEPEETGQGDHTRDSKLPTITLGSTVISARKSDLPKIAQLAYESVDETFLAQSATVELEELPQTRTGNRRRKDGRRVIAGNLEKPGDEEAAIGLVGEAAARAWLSRRYREVRWRSGYANLVMGDPDSSDHYGYDFEVTWRNTTLFYEVKSTTDSLRPRTQFDLTPSEVEAAQEHAATNRYRILLITSVLEPESRKLYEFPSPFSSKGRGRFRVVGRGLRYEVAPASRD